MTTRTRSVALLFLAFALATPVAACDADSPSGGTGALGDAPASGVDANAPDVGSTTPNPVPTTDPPAEESPRRRRPIRL